MGLFPDWGDLAGSQPVDPGISIPGPNRARIIALSRPLQQEFAKNQQEMIVPGQFSRRKMRYQIGTNWVADLFSDWHVDLEMKRRPVLTTHSN